MAAQRPDPIRARWRVAPSNMGRSSGPTPASQSAGIRTERERNGNQIASIAGAIGVASNPRSHIGPTSGSWGAATLVVRDERVAMRLSGGKHERVREPERVVLGA